jgi:chemotaxis protein methyltransferase CheR
LAQRQRSDRRLRIWSAGCATGEEAYSIAILLTEMVYNLSSWNILILATDINRDALKRAQEGLYAPWSFRGVEKRIQDTYFTPTREREYAIADRIKRMVTFDYLNLVADPYPSLLSNTNGMDVIFCRNVTIYFKPEVTQRVIRNLNSCLIEGGWLVPGAAEPNMVHYGAFEARNFPGTVVYRKPKANTVPSAIPGQKLGPESPQVPKPSPFSLPAVEPPPVKTDPFLAALDLLANGKTDEALRKLYEKLDLDANFVPTYYTLGKVYANRGNLEEAQHWCERAIAKDRLHCEPYYTLSLVYQEQGLTDMALDILKKALYLNREFVLAHYQMAILYVGQGDKDLARKSLENVLRLVQSRPAEECVPEGDGLVVERLRELVSALMAQMNQK